MGASTCPLQGGDLTSSGETKPGLTDGCERWCDKCCRLGQTDNVDVRVAGDPHVDANASVVWCENH